MEILAALYLFVHYAVVTIIVAVIALLLVRLLFSYVDVNPFGRIALTVRSMSDALIVPVRRGLIGFGVQPNLAPLITILLVILVGWFADNLASTILNTAAGVLAAGSRGAFVAVLGYVLYGGLALYSLMIFIRIIFSWGMAGYGNALMRFLVNATDPLLVPLRRIVPPFGMFDLSPMVAFIVIMLLQAAVHGTLLRDWPVTYIR
jgi:YggT family protein